MSIGVGVLAVAELPGVGELPAGDSVPLPAVGFARLPAVGFVRLLAVASIECS